MTQDEAKKILSGPLIFGDAKQIEALRFLNGPKEQTAEGDEAPGRQVCYHCNGEGTIEVECDCPICDGEGEIEA